MYHESINQCYDDGHLHGIVRLQTRPPPPSYLPINFEFVDTHGNSLISSSMDSVKIDYIEDGVLKYQNIKVKSLIDHRTAETISKKYNGYVINDEAFMTQLSHREASPVRDFHIYLSGVNMGHIYLNYWKMMGNIPSEHFTFNSISVMNDAEVANNSGLYLLQVK